MGSPLRNLATPFITFDQNLYPASARVSPDQPSSNYPLGWKQDFHSFSF